MKQKLSLVTLGVADIAIAREFYETVLGFVPEEASNENVAFYTVGSCLLSLFGREALAEDATVAGEGSGFRAVTLSP
jgi:uncharacterized protein